MTRLAYDRVQGFPPAHSIAYVPLAEIEFIPQFAGIVLSAAVYALEIVGPLARRAHARSTPRSTTPPACS